MERLHKRCLGLISAVAFEGGLFAAKGEQPGERGKPGPAFLCGEKEGTDFVYTASGIGKANAAHAAAVMIRDYSPSVIVCFGIGGAYPSSGLKIGDLAVAETETYADEGVLLKDGFHTLETIGLPTVRAGRRRYFNIFPSDRSLAGKAVRAARGITQAVAGGFATVSTSTGTKKRAIEIEKRFGVICENMEGAAVAQMCRLYGVPFVEIRGISNMVEDRDTAKWNMRLAAENCQRAVMRFLKMPEDEGKKARG